MRLALISEPISSAVGRRSILPSVPFLDIHLAGMFLSLRLGATKSNLAAFYGSEIVIEGLVCYEGTSTFLPSTKMFP